MNKKATTWLWVFLASTFLFLTSCKHEALIPNQPEISFTNDIQPILIANCTKSGCHSDIEPEKFSLLTYDDIITYGEIKPKDARGSKLYKAITGKPWWIRKMPLSPNTPLSDYQIKLIYLWIMQGASNN